MSKPYHKHYPRVGHRGFGGRGFVILKWLGAEGVGAREPVSSARLGNSRYREGGRNQGRTLLCLCTGPEGSHLPPSTVMAGWHISLDSELYVGGSQIH